MLGSWVWLLLLAFHFFFSFPLILLPQLFFFILYCLTYVIKIFLIDPSAALLLIVMFIFAIIGMNTFGHVKLNGSLDDTVNFRTFGNSMVLLFRLATAAGWNDILDGLLIAVSLEPASKQNDNGETGAKFVAFFCIISPAST